MLPLVRQYVAIIDIRKTGAHVSKENIKPYFNWLMQWPQALDLKCLPAWRLDLVFLHSTSKWDWLLFLPSCFYIIWKDILKDTYQCNLLVFLKDCARTLPSRVGCIGAEHPLACAGGLVWHKECFWRKWQHDGSDLQACMLEMERSWVWVYAEEIYFAWLLPLDRLVMSSLSSGTDTSIHG